MLIILGATVVQILMCIVLVIWLVSMLWSLVTDIKDRNVRIKRQNELWRRKNLIPKEELEDFLGGK